MRNLILLAVQGAGKGTLAKKLKEKYGYAHISTGDILRERASVGDELGNELKSMMDNGQLVPNDVIFEAVEYKITQPECANGYILDGFPRNLEQAQGYTKILEKLNMDAGVAINMTIPEELLVQRIIGRRMCKDCGAIYNIYNDQLKPTTEGICNKCGGALYQRDDDNEEAMKTRIETYFNVTAPVIDYYREKGILYEVDSTDSEVTLKSVEDILNSLGDKVD
ncbi:MAG: nucleoside monophosphate kinase [Bacilli bacterium]|nr:nucleoside monophosphate kinase [Bacilli bacterium]